MRVLRSLICSSVFAFVYFGAAASRADDCADLMAKDVAIDTGDSAAYNAIRNLACSLTFEKFGKSRGGSASADFSIFSGGLDFTETNYRKFRSEECKAGSTDEYLSSSYYNYRSSANPKSLDAVISCFRARSIFTCLPEPQGGSLVNVVVDWRSLANGKSVLKLMHSKGETSIKTSLKEGSDITKGESSVILGRDKNQELSFVANVEQNGLGFQCSAFVAPEVDPIIVDDVPPTLYTFDIVAYNNMQPTNPEVWSWYPVNAEITVDPTNVLQSQLLGKKILKILEVSTADAVFCADNCSENLTHVVSSISAEVVDDRWVRFIVRARGTEEVHPRYRFTVKVQELK